MIIIVRKEPMKDVPELIAMHSVHLWPNLYDVCDAKTKVSFRRMSNVRLLLSLSRILNILTMLHSNKKVLF